MLPEKKDGHIWADNANGGCLKIFSPQRHPPDRQVPQDQLSALFRGQNPAGRLRVCSLERTSEFAIRSACCSSSPSQEPASRSQAAPGVRAVAAPLSTSGGCKAAGLMESEPGPRSPAEYCLP